MNRYLKGLLSLIIASHVGASNAHESLVGTWSGSARYNAETTRLELHIEQRADRLAAHISLLDIGVSGWPATKIALRGNTLKVVLPSDSGPQQLDLRLVEGELRGTWKEKSYAEPAHILLTRVASKTGLLEQRIFLQGSAGQIGASLILPDGDGPFPAVVFLHGSGPQPRDASRFAAESFARQGIASLIYDKRGVAESAGSFQDVGFDELADDAVIAAKYLRGLSTVSAVGFWGHSQGGWLAPLAASKWQAAAFVITSAGPAVSPAREGEWGFVHAIQDRPDADQLIPLVREVVAAWHGSVRSGDWKNFNRLAGQYKRQDWFKQAGLRSLSNRPRKAYINNYKRFMDYDPMVILRSLPVPMLAIFAVEDESIDSAESMDLLSGLIDAGRNIRLVSYSGYSHAMRKTGLRFPHHPDDYFSRQADFIRNQLASAP